MVELGENWSTMYICHFLIFSSCSPAHPVREWLMVSYCWILALRIIYFLFELHIMFIKPMAILTTFQVIPFIVFTVLGTSWFCGMETEEPKCVSEGYRYFSSPTVLGPT